ncbi:MAG: YHS domain-containing (seleno)protein [Phycisphaerae bacterium]
MSMRRGFDRVVVPLAGALGAVAVAGTLLARAEEPKPEAEPKPAIVEQKPPSAPQVQNQKPEPALRGYCPTAYHLLDKAVKGDPANQSTYAGELYYLSSAEAKKQFDADPEKFLPQFAGLCTTALGGSYGNRLPSDPEVFAIVDGKLYLFSCKRAKRNYEIAPEIYISNATIRFNKPALDGYCPVSYQQRSKAIKGHQTWKERYRSSIYHFASAGARKAFIDDPEKYVPRYNGHCAEGMSRGKRYLADPTQFIVNNGKTYLFFDAKAKVRFQIDPTPVIKKADANWVTLENEEKTRWRELLESWRE